MPNTRGHQLIGLVCVLSWHDGYSMTLAEDRCITITLYYLLLILLLVSVSRELLAS